MHDKYRIKDSNDGKGKHSANINLQSVDFTY